MGRPKKEKPNRSDGRYEVKVKVGEKFDGTPIMKSFYSRISKEDAKAKAEKYKIEQAVYDATGEPPTSRDMPFDAWARKVLDVLRGTMKDSSFMLHYKNSIEKHLIPYFGKRKISTIKQIDVQKYFTDKQGAYSLETLKKHRMALNRIFEMAIQNDLILKNPCDGIRVASEKKRIEKHTYTQEQCDLVLSYAETHRYGLDVILMLSYGLTRSELLGIMWDDIDYDEKVLYIRRGVADVQSSMTGKMEVVIGETKNDFRKRAIPLSKHILDLLKNREKTGDFIFCTAKGTVQSPRTWSRRHFDVFMRDMHAYYEDRGIDVPILHPHELRHTRATLWVNDGKNLFAVADVLGHSDLKMLRKRYAHSDTESTREMLGIDESPDEI